MFHSRFRDLGARIMDIIGCRFQEVMYQQKKHMARVSDLYRERVRSIKTVLHVLYREREFIV